MSTLAKYRNSRPAVFCKKGALKNFAKFTGKYLCQSLFKKETLTQVFFCEFCEIFKNIYFYRTPLVAASENSLFWLCIINLRRHFIFCSRQSYSLSQKFVAKSRSVPNFFPKSFCNKIRIISCNIFLFSRSMLIKKFKKKFVKLF